MNKYEINETLGSISNSGVFLATEKSSGKKVAIKLFSNVSKTEEKSLLKDAHALIKINHPNIVKVLDSGSETKKGETNVFYVMEYLDGKPLYEHIPANQGLSFEESWHLVEGLANAMSMLHEMHILHLDLKPGNIVYSKREAKIIDFGLLIPKEEGSFRGTPGYVAPEIILGEKASERSDVYCFGALLAFIWTGKKLFHDETPEKTMAKQLKEFASTLESQSLSHIIKQATRKRPEDRYSSIGALFNDLASYHHEAEFKKQEPSENLTDSQGGHWVIGAAILALGAIAISIYYTLLTTI